MRFFRAIFLAILCSFPVGVWAYVDCRNTYDGNLYPINDSDNSDSVVYATCTCADNVAYYKETVECCFVGQGNYEVLSNGGYCGGLNCFRCVPCPDPDKSVADGGTGQPIGVNSENKKLFSFITNTSSTSDISGCTLQPNPNTSECRKNNNDIVNINFSYNKNDNLYHPEPINTSLVQPGYYAIDYDNYDPNKAFETDVCLKCPDADKSVDDGGTGQTIGVSELGEQLFGFTDMGKGIESCSLKLQKGHCNFSTNVTQKTSVVYAFDSVRNKYVRKSDYEVYPLAGYYTDVQDDTGLENDYCVACPVPGEDTDQPYASELYSWIIGSNDKNAGVENCALKLSQGACCFKNCSGEQSTNVVYAYNSGEYVRVAEYTVVPGANADIATYEIGINDLSKDYCVRTYSVEGETGERLCSGGYCVDEEDKCVKCPAGYSCPDYSLNLMCQDVKPCDINEFSVGGASQCTKCAGGYSTFGSAPGEITENNQTVIIPNGLCLGREEAGSSVVFGKQCIKSDACKVTMPQLCLKENCLCTNLEVFNESYCIDLNGTCNKNGEYYAFNADKGQYCKIKFDYSTRALFEKVYKCNKKRLERYYGRVYKNKNYYNRQFCQSSFGMGDGVNVDSVNKSVLQIQKDRDFKYLGEPSSGQQDN